MGGDMGPDLPIVVQDDGPGTEYQETRIRGLCCHCELCHCFLANTYAYPAHRLPERSDHLTILQIKSPESTELPSLTWSSPTLPECGAETTISCNSISI